MSEGTKLDNIENLENKGVENESNQQINDSSSDHSSTEKNIIESTSSTKSTSHSEENENSPTAQQPNTDSSDNNIKFEDSLNLDLLDCNEGEIVKGKILRIEQGLVYLDISFKSEAYFELIEAKEDVASGLIDLSIGATLDVLIEKLENKEGYTVLSYKKAKAVLIWEKLNKLLEDETVVQILVKNKVEGGLIVSYSDIRGFIPSSQISKEFRDKKPEELVGQSIPAVFLQVDRRRKKIILSNRYALDQATKEDFNDKIKSFEEGESYTGKVSNITNFGAFIDLGGVEGLVHISEISWSRIVHPSEVLSIGQEVNVLILSIEKDEKRISLGMKQLLPDPWEGIEDQFKVGDFVEGEVLRLVPFGFFVKLKENLEGLVHISEISFDRVEKVEDFVSVGDKKTFVVIKVNPDEQKIGLSLKQISKFESAKNSGTSIKQRSKHIEPIETDFSKQLKEIQRLNQEKLEQQKKSEDNSCSSDS